MVFQSERSMMSNFSFSGPRKGGLLCLVVLLSATATLFFIETEQRPLLRSLSTQDQRSLEYASATIYDGFEQGVLTNESPAGQAESATGKKPRFVIHMGPMKTGTSSL